MKKLVLAVCVCLVSVTMFAQNRFEQAAKKTVEQMKEVLKISDKQADDIYAIELNKNVKIAEIRKENVGDQPKIQSEIKIVNQEANQKTKDIIGSKNMVEWTKYVRSQREKKE